MYCLSFKVCISIQRCAFLLHPFAARRWRRRYDLLISITVWVVVSLGCSPFILMRSSSSSPGSVTQADYNMSFSPEVTSHQQLIGSVRPVSPSPHGSGLPPQLSCFKDLPMRRLSVSLAVTMTVLAELLGFVIPLACISYSSFLIARSLKQGQTCDERSSSARSRPPSLSIQSESFRGKQTNAEKQRALKMVLSCSALFLVCFAPYHINFLFYLMVSQGIVSHCATELAVRRFHPLSLCLASLSCCLNPLLYYFLNAEFRLHLSRRASSFSSSVFSSLNSPTQRLSPRRLLSTESNCSDRQWPPSPTED